MVVVVVVQPSHTDIALCRPWSASGPTADGRIKPELYVTGEHIFVAHADATYSLEKGTQYSAPIVAAMAAVLWQQHPTWTSSLVRAALMSTASYGDAPSIQFGWGKPGLLLTADYVPPVSPPDCIANCNGHGDCVRGVCLCDNTRYGVACEMTRGAVVAY